MKLLRLSIVIGTLLFCADVQWQRLSDIESSVKNN